MTLYREEFTNYSAVEVRPTLLKDRAQDLLISRARDLEAESKVLESVTIQRVALEVGTGRLSLSVFDDEPTYSGDVPSEHKKRRLYEAMGRNTALSADRRDATIGHMKEVLRDVVQELKLGMQNQKFVGRLRDRAASMKDSDLEAQTPGLAAEIKALADAFEHRALRSEDFTVVDSDKVAVHNNGGEPLQRHDLTKLTDAFRDGGKYQGVVSRNRTAIVAKIVLDTYQTMDAV